MRWRAGGKHKVYLKEFLFAPFHLYLKNFAFRSRIKARVSNSLMFHYRGAILRFYASEQLLM
jgi:hypothetical protein